MQESDLTIILPTYNEEGAVGLVIDEIKALSLNCNILVVDGNSIDETSNIVAWKKVPMMIDSGEGKGSAMQQGFKAVKTPYVIMMDSDYTYPAEYIPLMYYLLISGYNVVTGYRYSREKDSMTSLNLVGNRMLSFLASILYRYDIIDVCSGMWGFRKEALEGFNLISKGFTFEADLFINARKNNCRISQIPITYRKRPEGSRAKLKVSDGLKIGWFLLRGKVR